MPFKNHKDPLFPMKNYSYFYSSQTTVPLQTFSLSYGAVLAQHRRVQKQSIALHCNVLLTKGVMLFSRFYFDN